MRLQRETTLGTSHSILTSTLDMFPGKQALTGQRQALTALET